MIKIKPKLTPIQRAQHLKALNESAKRRTRIHEIIDGHKGSGKGPKIIQSIAGEDSKRDRVCFGESEAIAEARKPRKGK